MNAYEVIRINEEFKVFASRNFEKPSFCRNLAQVRFYSTELYAKIAECENTYNHAPEWAYKMLEEYNRQLDILTENNYARTSH